jgi:hypothetical protein
MTWMMEHQLASAAPPTQDRIAYGASCTWWGSLEDAGIGLACPHCHGPLIVGESLERWQQDLELQDALNPGYKAFIDWLRGHWCYPTMLEAEAAYWTARAVTRPTVTVITELRHAR